ncbi:pyridoxamine 5'-phosphate oxidase family protein [Microbacterium elymi]|uniref:Pyridoxamine 5'-phosphate oxidase family protein n=1 Tax=Microbacterium elymi TaxID=2909587 RepID=A0ABY5NK65_9MICO|nr:MULTISPECIES: pyridoxamine 5'-phosphate oxidase family protein [Microbacterium]UUT35552.1 pyridoxamine 5'-phosphate oxidase family protein [Microbacterium elymi]
MDAMTRGEWVAFVQAAGRGVVATVDAQGHPEAALVGLAVTDDGELVFDSFADARKIVNLRTQPRVAIVIGREGEDVCVQVEGRADVLSASERDEYGRAYLDRFPGSRVLDDQLAVVRVVPAWLRRYDARQEPSLVTEQSGFPAA